MAERLGEGWPPARTSVVAGIAIAVAVAALLVRVVSIAEPLGIDQSLWASAARGMARGQVLYVDVWEQRPPGIYWMYLAGFTVFGWTPAAVAWLDILAAAITTWLLYFIGTTLNSRLTGAVAAMLYASLTLPPWLYSHNGFLERSVSETFIVVCVAAAAWCAAAASDRRSTVAFATVGFVAGAAVVFKPNAALYLPALLVWMILHPRRPAGDRSGSLVRPLLAAGMAGAIVPATAIMWLWGLGALGEAKIAVVDFNRFYVGQGFTVSGMALAFSKAVWLRMKTDPLWASGSVAAVVSVWEIARRRRLPPVAALAVVWGGVAAVAIFVNGIRLFNTYFVQALAPLALLSAWLFTEAVRQSRAVRVVAAVTAIVMAGSLVQRNYAGRVLESVRADLARLTGRIDRETYLERFGGYGNARGYSARGNAELAEYIRQHTAPDDRIFLFGINGAGVYFAADRLTAHRFLRVNFFVLPEFPDPGFRLSAVLSELSARRPRYIIFERLHSASEMGRAADSLPQHADVVRLLSAYRLETTIEDFAVYRRLD